MTSPPRGLLRILEVLHVLDEYEEPVAYDLIGLGLRLRDLGTKRLTWADLYTVLSQQPRTSAVYRARNPEHEWGLSEQLLALVGDALHVANWQRSRGKKRDYPKPIPRPGVEPDAKTYGGKKPLPIDDMAEWLGWN